MRAVLQRVRRGRVSVENKTIAEINQGLVILLGIGGTGVESSLVVLSVPHVMNGYNLFHFINTFLSIAEFKTACINTAF